MRFLRMLTNALAAGALAAAFLTVLILQLNPKLPLQISTVLPLYVRVASFYGLVISLVFYASILFRVLVAREWISPGWVSLRLLTWLSAAVVVGAAVLMWANFWGYRLVLPDAAERRMAAGAAATTGLAVLLLILSAVHYSFGRRGSRVGAALLTLTIAASVSFPVIARGRGDRPAFGTPDGDASIPLTSPPSIARVSLIALDGASLDFIAVAAAEGRLPNFGRMLDAGAAMHLSTLRPTQPAPVWAAAMTGKHPPGNGIGAAAQYVFHADGPHVELLPDFCFAHALVHFGILRERALGAHDLRARPLWAILSGAGLSVGVVGFPLTDPAPAVEGYVLSDRFHLEGHEASGAVPPTTGWPREAVALARSTLAAYADDGATPGGDPLGEESGWSAALAGLRTPPIPRDATYRAVSQALRRQYAPQIAAVRYTGLDLAGHHFLRFAMPRAFGDVSDDERARYGRVLDRYYDFVDAEIGSAIAALGDDDLLLVVSGFGIEPVHPAKRLLARVMGDPDLSGTHERGPSGFLMAYGGPVASGHLPLGSIADVAPTVLYFLGLPLARDMDGHARTDVFDRTFTATHPLTFIPSYDR